MQQEQETQKASQRQRAGRPRGERYSSDYYYRHRGLGVCFGYGRSVVGYPRPKLPCADFGSLVQIDAFVQSRVR